MKPVVTDQGIEVYLNGTVFDGAYVVPATPISSLDVNLTDRNQMMMDVSTYTVDSLLSVFQGKKLLEFNLDNATFGGLL